MLFRSNDTATTEIYTLSLHDALPIFGTPSERVEALRAVFARLPSEARQYFQVAPDLSFVTDSAWFETTRAA